MEPERVMVKLKLEGDFAVDRSMQSRMHLKMTFDAEGDYLVETEGCRCAVHLSAVVTSHCGCKSLQAARSATSFSLPVDTQPQANAEMCLSGLSDYQAAKTDLLGFC